MKAVLSQNEPVPANLTEVLAMSTSKTSQLGFMQQSRLRLHNPLLVPLHGVKRQSDEMGGWIMNAEDYVEEASSEYKRRTIYVKGLDVYFNAESCVHCIEPLKLCR